MVNNTRSDGCTRYVLTLIVEAQENLLGRIMYLPAVKPKRIRQCLFFENLPSSKVCAAQEDGTTLALGAEGHSMLRALSLSLYLLFPSDEGKLGVEAIGSKHLHRGLKILKQKPIVPGFGDMPLPLTFILHELSPFLIAHGMLTVHPVPAMMQASIAC